MNIGIFTDCYYPQINGVVTSILTLKEELEGNGHKVYIITAKMPGHKNSSEDVIRLSSIPFSKWKEFRLAMPFITRAYYKIKHLNLDIIHTQTEMTIGLLGRFMASSLNIPLVHTYHTMYEDYTHYLATKKYTKMLAKRLIIRTSRSYVKPATAIIAPTEKTKRALESYGVKNYIHVLPTGIDINGFETIHRDLPEVQALYKKHNLQSTDSIMLYLGRISQEKSIDMIINQMPTILANVANPKFLIVGDGPYIDQLKQLASDLDLDQHIIFVGRIPFSQVGHYYALADVFTSASKTETQGLTILEAMASNTPVVVFDDDNVRGVIEHNDSGMLFNNPIALSNHLITVLNDPEKQAKLAVSGQNSVKALSKEVFGQNAINIYSDLIRYKGSYELKVM